MSIQFLRCGFVGLLAVTLLLVGCSTGRHLMPVPVVYTAQDIHPFDLPPALQTSEIDVLYVTDRVPEVGEDGELGYGFARSPSVAFGSALVGIGSELSWKVLADDATQPSRSRPLELSLGRVVERGRAPATPIPLVRVDGELVADPEGMAANRATTEQFRQELLGRLALTPRKEVFVYIHGVQSVFADGIFTTAELWHFLGREGVAVAYSWPSGHPSLLRSYGYDRESGEFTVFHFKQFLRSLADISEVDTIHLIAYSRGSDVAITALRELFIEARSGGYDPRQRFRIANVILAAPDLDLDVTLQRLAAERLSSGIERLTIYTSDRDRALGFARIMFGSILRLGVLDDTVLTEGSRAQFAFSTNTAVIQYVGKDGGEYGHSYFRSNPHVASDLILTLRYNRDPGPAHGRPLKHRDMIFWEIDDDYLIPGE
ncbi:MAG: alpha/beta hydrolase [Candidatus Competibacterales bacterium]